MVYVVKKLGCGGLGRPQYTIDPSYFPFRVPYSLPILTEEFNVFDDIYGTYGYVPARHFPSSSYSPSEFYKDLTRVGLDSVVYEPTQIDMQCLFNAMRKGSVVPCIYPVYIQHELVEITKRLYGSSLIGSSCCSTLEEAMEGIDLSKSPGFPLYYRYTTKEKAWANERDHIVHQVKKFLKDPGSVLPLWTGTLKDELTNIQKVKDKSTRMFFNGTFWFLIVCNIIWKDMFARLDKNVGRHPSTIGISVPGPDLPNILLEFQQHFDELQHDGAVFITPEVIKDRSTKYKHVKYFHTLVDDDHAGFDLSLSPTGVAAVCEVTGDYLPHLSTIVIDGEHITFDPRAVNKACFEAIYHGYTVVGGVVFAILGNKSGQRGTGHQNSLHEPVAHYPAIRKFLGEDPVNCFLAGLYRAGGDDGLKHMVFREPISLEEWVERSAKFGTYLSSVSGFTDNALNMMYYSHKVSKLYFREYDFTAYIARPRKDKLLSALAWRKRNSDVLTVARMYAICNGLFGYEERYRALCMVDEWVGNHPRNRNPDPDWKMAVQQRLSDGQLLQIHTGNFQ